MTEQQQQEQVQKGAVNDDAEVTSPSHIYADDCRIVIKAADINLLFTVSVGQSESRHVATITMAHANFDEFSKSAYDACMALRELYRGKIPKLTGLNKESLKTARLDVESKVAQAFNDKVSP